MKYRIIARLTDRNESVLNARAVLQVGAELLAELQSENAGLEKALCNAVGDTERLRVKLER